MGEALGTARSSWEKVANSTGTQPGVPVLMAAELCRAAATVELAGTPVESATLAGRRPARSLPKESDFFIEASALSAESTVSWCGTAAAADPGTTVLLLGAESCSSLCVACGGSGSDGGGALGSGWLVAAHED
eukprot:scaffold83273_cov30-Tisochrysis_lutea.AAC.2